MKFMLAAVLVAATALPAAAWTEDQIDWCGDGGFPPDMQIRGCTAAIQSGEWSGKSLAWVYINRGNAYYTKHDYDGAIADYDEAIRLDPSDVNAYNNRGNAYHDKHDDDRAIASYDQAIRLNPDYAYAYKGRGSAYDSKHDYNHAIADYDQAIRLDSSDVDSHERRAKAHHDRQQTSTK